MASGQPLRAPIRRSSSPLNRKASAKAPRSRGSEPRLEIAQPALRAPSRKLFSSLLRASPSAPENADNSADAREPFRAERDGVAELTYAYPSRRDLLCASNHFGPGPRI